MMIVMTLNRNDDNKICDLIFAMGNLGPLRGWGLLEVEFDQYQL